MDNTARANTPRFDLPRIGIHHIALAVVAFALVVMAPRLTLAFLLADGLSLDEATERQLLIMTAVATALVVTLGNAFLSHVLALHFNRSTALHWLLFIVWAAYIGLTVAIIPPVLMVNLQSSPLAKVLTETSQQWQWAQAVTVLVEVLVAGSMMAYAIVKRAATTEALPATPEVAPVLLPATHSEPVQLDELSQRIIAVYKANPAASDTQAASEAGTTRPTLKNRVAKLQAAGIIHVNGVKTVTTTNGNGAH